MLKSILCAIVLVPCLLGAGPARAQRNPEHVPGELLVKYRVAVDAASRLELEQTIGAKRVRSFRSIGVEHVRLDPPLSVERAIERFRADPRVEYAEPNYVVRAALIPNDPSFSSQWGLLNVGQVPGIAHSDIRADTAWDIYTGDPTLKIGVLDTGVDYTHPDLIANIWLNEGELGLAGEDDDNNGYVDDLHGYNFVNDDGVPFDNNQHGTHIAGIIAARGNNGRQVTGVAWQGSIVAIKVLSGSGFGSVSMVIAGIEYATVVGVRLACNSWVTEGPSEALRAAINAAGSAGMLFVTAAGNDGVDLEQRPMYPASFVSPYIITVAASNASDSLAAFSNYGSASVDLAAPGVGILSTTPNGLDLPLSGTSMAAAHVAGVCALAMGRFPTLGPSEIKQRVLSSVDVRPGLFGRLRTSGRVNATQALGPPDVFPPGQVTDLAVTQPGSTTVGLIWTAPGDDGNTGATARYEIRHSTAPITEENFNDAAVTHGSFPGLAGSRDSIEVSDLAPSTTYFFALKAFDENGNDSPISNVVSATTLGPPVISTTPDLVALSLLTGEIGTRTLEIHNTGEGALDFTIPTPTVTAVTTGPSPAISAEPINKNEPDRRIGVPVLEAAGGPDALGYRWIDSDHPDGPPFHWVDVTTVGTLLPIVGDDSRSDPIDLGFRFPFYGETFDQVRVFTNGYLSFSDTASTWNNQRLPSDIGARNMVAPLWDDLDLGTQPRVYVYQDGDRFIVSWVGVSHYLEGGPYTFQALLYATGEIRFQYLSLAEPTNSATVGIQNEIRNVGLTAAFNAGYLHDSLAVRFRYVPPWLSVNPTSGRIPPGKSALVQVRFDATGLPTSFLNGSISIFSNVPDGIPHTVPTMLHVIGAPDVVLDPIRVDFDTVFTDTPYHRIVTISNPGTLGLEVRASSDDPNVSTVPARFTVPPGGSREVEVRIQSPTARNVSALVHFATNDISRPHVYLPVSALAVVGPHLTVSPDSVVASLPTDGETSRVLRISNQGGATLEFNASAFQLDSKPRPATRPAVIDVATGKGEPDRVHGPQPLRFGGPDGFGYTYADSDEPGGPGFFWVDIRGVGLRLPIVGDDASAGPYPIGFEFPFYGLTFNSFRLCTNGFISFTSNRNTFDNRSLPNNSIGVPENLLAVFWDDLTFGTVQSAYYHYDGTRLVIQFQDVPRLSETQTNTFEIILYPDGRIVYQYLSMASPLLNSATIGIQNAARDAGLEVAYNAAYLHNNLAIRFRPPSIYLSVFPSQGIVPPGGSQDLQVGFSANGLPGGVYRGGIRIDSNDPARPELDVPTRLDVLGIAKIAVRDTVIDFGNAFIGFPRTHELVVQNEGSIDLTVTGITSSDPAYRVDVTGFSVAPQGSDTVRVTFDPSTAGSYPATLTIASNDPNTPNLTVRLAGTGAVAPDIRVTPAELRAALATNLHEGARITTRSVVLENLGGSDLAWTALPVVAVSLKQRAGLEPSSIPLDLERAKGAPEPEGRAVLESAGGPDALGYRWKDSDELGAQPFSWIDITGVGTRLEYIRDDETTAPIALPFRFSFYGQSFDSVRICNNGWLSFTSMDSTYSNVGLPNSGRRTPENLMAVFWDDLDLRANGRVYYHQDGTRFIVSFIDVPHWISSGTPPGVYTFQVVLHSGGEIDFQYLKMQGLVTSATIGIQNATKDVGLQIAYNAAYVHDSLRVRITRRPDWLKVLPVTGVTPAGERDTLRVQIDALGLADGDHQGSLEIASNDPTTPQVVVPVHLHVGVVDGTLRLEPDFHAVVPSTTWIPASLATASCNPQAIVPASVRIADSIGVAPGAPVQFQACDAIFGFDPIGLITALPAGEQVSVTAVGEIADVTWFVARDSIRLLKPTLQRPPGPYLAGSQVSLTWTDAPASPTSRYDLWFSPNGGGSWQSVATSLTDHQYLMTMPATAVDNGYLELVAHDAGDGGYVGSSFSGPFVVTAGAFQVEAAKPPLRFGLRLSGSNPVRVAALLELSLPHREPVQIGVYDVRGALVRGLGRGVWEPGTHAIRWDGADHAGRPAAAGIYFVRAVTAAHTTALRLALIR